MGTQKNVEGILNSIHTELISQANGLLSASSISYAELRKLHYRYTALLQEAKEVNPKLHKEFRRDYEIIQTELRVRIKKALFESVHELTSLIQLLSTPDAKIGVDDKNALGYIGDARQIAAPSSENLPQTYESGGRQKILTDILKKVKPLMGTYVSVGTICQIAGYTKSGFYKSISGQNIKKQGAQYLIDESTIPIYFGQRQKEEIHTLQPQPPANGVWMSVKDIQKKFDYAASNRQTIYDRLKEHRAKIPTRKEDNKILYLIDDSTLSIFERKRKKHKSTSEPESKGDMEYEDIMKVLTPRFGDKADSAFLEIMKNHGERLQVSQNRFSRKVLVEILQSEKTKG